MDLGVMDMTNIGIILDQKKAADNPEAVQHSKFLRNTPNILIQVICLVQDVPALLGQ